MDIFSYETNHPSGYHPIRVNAERGEFIDLCIRDKLCLEPTTVIENLNLEGNKEDLACLRWSYHDAPVGLPDAGEMTGTGPCLDMPNPKPLKISKTARLNRLVECLPDYARAQFTNIETGCALVGELSGFVDQGDHFECMFTINETVGNPASCDGEIFELRPIHAVEASGASSGQNVGTAGVGVYKDTVGPVLRFKKVNAASSKITVADDVPNDELKLDANITWADVSGKPVSFPPDAHTLGSHSDVNVGGAVDNDVIKLSGATWVKSRVNYTELNGVPADFPPQAHALTSHNDVDVTGLNDKEILKWNLGTGKWEPEGMVVPNLEDTEITAVADNDVLTWEAASLRWKNKPVAAGGAKLQWVYKGSFDFPTWQANGEAPAGASNGSFYYKAPTEASESVLHLDLFNGGLGDWLAPVAPESSMTWQIVTDPNPTPPPGETIPYDTASSILTLPPIVSSPAILEHNFNFVPGFIQRQIRIVHLFEFASGGAYFEFEAPNEFPGVWLRAPIGPVPDYNGVVNGGEGYVGISGPWFITEINLQDIDSILGGGVTGIRMRCVHYQAPGAGPGAWHIASVTLVDVVPPDNSQYLLFVDTSFDNTNRKPLLNKVDFGGIIHTIQGADKCLWEVWDRLANPFPPVLPNTVFAVVNQLLEHPLVLDEPYEFYHQHENITAMEDLQNFTDSGIVPGVPKMIIDFAGANDWGSVSLTTHLFNRHHLQGMAATQPSFTVTTTIANQHVPLFGPNTGETMLGSRYGFNVSGASFDTNFIIPGVPQAAPYTEGKFFGTEFGAPGEGLLVVRFKVSVGVNAGASRRLFYMYPVRYLSGPESIQIISTCCSVAQTTDSGAAPGPIVLSTLDGIIDLEDLTDPNINAPIGVLMHFVDPDTYEIHMPTVSIHTVHQRGYGLFPQAPPP